MLFPVAPSLPFVVDGLFYWLLLVLLCFAWPSLAHYNWIADGQAFVYEEDEAFELEQRL